MRVLIVEDDALIAMGCELTLTDAGHTVVGIAPDMANALRLAEQTRPDVALVDMQLADGPTGNVVAQALHARHGVRPIFTTANADMVTAESRAISLALLSKPVSGASLVASAAAAARLIGGVH